MIQNEKRLKIVHYLPQFLGVECGTANAVRGWSEALAEQGVEVLALSDAADVVRPCPPTTECIPLRHRSRGRARFTTDIGNRLDGADLFVAHGGWTLANVLACKAARRRGIPYVVTTHGVYNEEVLNRKKTSKLLWNTAVERGHLNRALGLHLFFPDERAGLAQMEVDTPTIVVPNGIAAPDGVAWDNGSGDYLLWLGRFDPFNKGLDLLLEALSLLPASERPRLRLHGPDWRGKKSEVIGTVERLGLQDWVTVGEPIYGDDKWSLVSHALGSVYPSRWDACPTAVAESVCAGVPTLVSGFPLGRMLAQERAAIEVELTPRSVADGIRRMLSSEGTEIGRRGTQVAAERLSWPAVARSWMDQISALRAPSYL